MMEPNQQWTFRGRTQLIKIKDESKKLSYETEKKPEIK